MRSTTRWSGALLVLLLCALGAPRVKAQTAAPRASAAPSAGASAAADEDEPEPAPPAGVSAGASAGPSAAPTAGGTLVTSGAADAGASTGLPARSSSGLTELSEVPREARTPRPPPSAEQLEALRLLESEIDGFTSRGEQFRSGVNGLLRREHDTQIERLRRGFDRQIAAEREAEGQARRHAIQVFERFLEQYPDDPDHSPDVMFRLSELYYDEAQYAKLEADEALDRLRAQREAAGQSTDDLGAPPPVDYRCSILLYRSIAARFPSFRLRDTTHYLLGWVLKEMGREDEAMTSYRALVCPSRYNYTPEMDLNAQLVQGQDTPVACPRVFDILRPSSLTSITPPPAPPRPEGQRNTGINATLVEPGRASDTEPMPIAQDYNACVPMNGANGQQSRYTSEVWYYLGDYHFDNPPIGNGDLGNSYAIAAYRQSMRTGETRRAAAAGGASPAPGLATAVNNDAASVGGVTAENSPGRRQFSAETDYGTFWAKSLYKVGWSYFRMLNGYPLALQSFSLLLDYYDYRGETGAQTSRTDTIKWIGVIFSENSWGLASSNDAFECQALVETVAHPPPDPQRMPFDCAGIMRITSPYSPQAIMGAAPAPDGVRVAPQPGRPSYIPQDRPWTPEAYLELANDYFQQTKYYEAITLYRIFLRLYPLHFQAPRVAESIAIAYERQRQYDQAIAARGRLADYLEHTRWWDANNSHPDAQRYAELVALRSLHDNAIQHHRRATEQRAAANNLFMCIRGTAVDNVCTPPAGRTAADRNRAMRTLEGQYIDMLTRADGEYTLAIEAYQRFIENYPNDEEAYQFRYNRADALYWGAITAVTRSTIDPAYRSQHASELAQRFVASSRAYAEVRESNENDQYLVPASYMAIKALEQALRAAAGTRAMEACLAVRANMSAAELRDYATGQPLLTPAEGGTAGTPPTPGTCQLPPPAAGAAAPATSPSGGSATPPAQTFTQLNIPDMVRQLMEARVAYSSRVPQNLDNDLALREVVTSDPEHPENNPPYRAKFAYLNASTLYRFGHVADAEARFRQILDTYCDDEVVAGQTFRDLFNMLLAQGREDDREALARSQTERRCRGVDPGPITDTLTDARFRHALDTFHQAERASGEEALRLYERAATQMRQAIEANRNHRQAPLALFYTALAYERTNRFDTATQTYVRITQEFNNLTVNGSNPPVELTGEDRSQRINTLELSNFRAGVNLERIFDYDGAIRYFGTVVSDTRFASANDHDSHVHDSLLSIAQIHTNLGRWQQARDAWRAFLPHAAAGREQATAQYRQFEMPFRAQEWANAVRSFQEYRRTVPMSEATAEFHVQAQYNIATALRNSGDTRGYQRELRAVAAVFRASRQPPASRAASYAAEALFLDLDVRMTAFLRRTLTQGTADALRTQIRTIKTELDAIDTQSTEIVNLQGGEYTIGALVRTAEGHEYLATQLARVTTLIQPSRADQQTAQRAQQAIARLRSAGEQLRRVGRDEQADQIDARAQALEDQLQQQTDERNATVQRTFDSEAEAERKLAIQNYAIAIHLARRDNIPTAFAARALEHMRLEENRPLIDTAVQGINPQLAASARFTYRQGMFDSEAPGLTVTQQQPVATPGLAGE